MLAAPDTTISIRWAFPFMRVTGASPGELELLMRAGISPMDFAKPNTRVPHRVMVELLRATVEELGDPLLGLRAGERIEPGDFATLEFACRSCANLRESIVCANRYMYLMHGAQEARLIERGDTATWELRVTDGVEQPPALNDFALTTACLLSRRHTGLRHVLREVHFAHRVATSAEEYTRVFDGAKIKLGMPHNALVFARHHLDAPLQLAHPGLQQAFELHAIELLEQLLREESLYGKVRRLLIEQLAAGETGMTTVARKLAMSVATLRRRLSEEGTSHSAILDKVRSELSQRYLADPRLAISEVAFLLGFKNVTAFYKAFRRWSDGRTPASFRADTQRR